MISAFICFIIDSILCHTLCSIGNNTLGHDHEKSAMKFYVLKQRVRARTFFNKCGHLYAQQFAVNVLNTNGKTPYIFWES